MATTTANVKVVLKKAGGKNPARIHGKITAYDGNSTDEEGIVIFKKEGNNHTQVMLENPIPLSKTVIEDLPLNSSLSVKANLWLHDINQSSNLQMVDGTADFPTKMTGESTNNISGQNGEIEVKVTWGA